MTIAGIQLAVRRRSDPRWAMPLAWAGVVLIPLCLAGQKQPHYLLPMIPPLAMLTGWYVDRAIRTPRSSAIHRFALTLLTLTAMGCAVGGLFVPIVGRVARGHVAWLDIVATVGVFPSAGTVAAVLVRRGGSVGLLAQSGVTVVVVTTLAGLWTPTLDPSSPKAIAGAIRHAFGNRPVAYFRNESLALQFHMRRDIPHIASVDVLADTVAHDPPMVVVAEESNDPSELSTYGLSPRLAFQDGRRTIRVYQVRLPQAFRLLLPTSVSARRSRHRVEV